MNPQEKAFIASHRVARLATADAAGRPHAVPVGYAFDGRHIYSALDLKPKRTHALRLKRVRNILENPNVALVIDDYSEDWDSLAYVLVTGAAELVESPDEQRLAERLLREKYPQYARLLEPGSPTIRLTPARVVSWGKLP
ncbi:MAG: TIGR03668 family PPOX class F420-dependent oxidoreductase [SAR202 cluster bacterium]|nr:TIGR03668 family PPOX class F420-dependent oxidoreductase [SAR202 cluster bacterium]